MTPWPVPMWPEFWPWAAWRRQGAPQPQPAAARRLAARYGRRGVPPWAWLRLLALGPLPPRPPAPLTVEVPAVLHRYVFTTTLSNFNGAERQLAWMRGYRTLLVQLADGSLTAALNVRELEERASAYRAEGWRLVGWSACQDGRPELNAQLAATEVHERALDGWVTDWETWGEGDLRALPGRWLREWQTLNAPAPLGLSCLSSVTPLFARSFNYAPWVAARTAIMPQVYGDAYAGYTVAAMLASFKLAGVPRELLAPTLGAVGPLDPYADYATWTGPRGVWVGGQVRDWAKLAAG